jgi:hypothetical protein
MHQAPRTVHPRDSRVSREEQIRNEVFVSYVWRSYIQSLNQKIVPGLTFEILGFLLFIHLDSFFRKPRPSPPNNEPFIQEMHLKMPVLSRGLKLSNSKPGCRVSALHFLGEIDTTNDFLTSSSIRWAFFSASYFRINPCFTAEKRIGVWIVTHLADTGKLSSSNIYSLCTVRGTSYDDALR